jgi:hypothetical protein
LTGNGHWATGGRALKTIDRLFFLHNLWADMTVNAAFLGGVWQQYLRHMFLYLRKMY